MAVTFIAGLNDRSEYPLMLPYGPSSIISWGDISPSIIISASAGTKRSLFSALTKFIGSRFKPPAISASLTPRAPLAPAIVRAGGAPIAIAKGIGVFREQCFL